MAVFEVKKLSFTYPQCRQTAIDGISLTIEKGEFLVVCGPSGCGKSTLLRQFKTALAPFGIRSGEILFDGQPLQEINAHTQAEKIGFVSQSPENQIVTDKVWHELAFGLESLGLPTAAIRGRVAEMAAFFGMEGWFYKNVTELSGGQKQLLNLASVMVMQPEALILDEPTSQLDPVAASEFLGTLAKINRELGTTILLTEHRLEEAFPLASRVAVMEQGKILCAGTPQEAGLALKSRSSGMFLAMPAPMRVWVQTQSPENCPVTIPEGRAWLEKYSREHLMQEIPPKEPPWCSPKTAIKIEDAWFRYEKDSPDILKGLSLSIQEGEFLAILGGNGAGKTTALKLISRQKSPYRGEVRTEGTIAALPQNPQALFVKKTLREDLLEIINEKQTLKSKELQERRMACVAALCKLELLLDRHPYDLSGGEQQRAALAKVLMQEPEILLLDEPTKGFDAEFKRDFAGILRTLSNHHVTIFMVSHDIEFCAKYAHRCALFFDGHIVTDGTPERFFSGNRFYTTAASRMARDILPAAVTTEDLIAACGGKVPEEPLPQILLPYEEARRSDHEMTPNSYQAVSRNLPPLKMWRKLIALVSGLTALALFFYATGAADLSSLVASGGMTAPGTEQLKLYAVMIGALSVCAAATYRKAAPTVQIQTPKEKRKLPGRTAAASLLILLMIPLTLYVNIFYFESRQYYMTAFMVLAECMLPFFLVFEGRKPKARELVLIASLCAIAVAGRLAFFMLPQFKPVAALVIIAGIAFGGETGFLVGAMTMLLSNMLFSQGPWTPFQMFAMGIIGFLAGVLFQKGLLMRSRISMCIFGALSVLLVYGGIMNPASALIWGGEGLNPDIILAYYLTGFPMDLIHAAATAIFLWFGAEPMLEKLDRIKVKYGLVE